MHVINSPTPDEDWETFESDLTLCLSDLSEDDFLVVTAKKSGYYIQFAAEGQFGMRVEAMSNTYAAPAESLSTEANVTMEQLGWKSPSSSPNGSPNFFLDVSIPVDFKALAGLAVKTFRGVYRIFHPGLLQYKAFSSSGTQIRFPTLRLKREESLRSGPAPSRAVARHRRSGRERETRVCLNDTHQDCVSKNEKA